MTFEEKRDEAAKVYRDEDLKNNPNGYTVSTYCNSNTTEDAFISGADWSREECAKFWIHECDQLRSMCEKMAKPLKGFVDYAGGFSSDNKLGSEALAEWDAMKGE